MASTLLEVIKFRDLADSLTDNEFDIFLLKIFNKFNKRQLISTSLFHLFKEQGCQNQQLATTINIISSIIQSRNKASPQHANPIKFKTIPKKQNPSPLSFTSLPSDVIGFCASYLSFNDYHSFEKCSRQIYIGCNNPNTLKCIDKAIFEKNRTNNNHLLQSQHLKLAKYQKATHFEMELGQFMQMKGLHNIKVSSNITSLALGPCYIQNETPKQFLNTKTFDFDKIHKLDVKFMSYWPPNLLPNQVNKFTPQKYADNLCEVLTKFQNLKFLKVASEHFLNPDWRELQSKLDEQLGDHFGKLDGICLFGSDPEFSDILLHHICDKLVSLHIDKNINSPINGFNKLQELCIFNADYNKIYNVIKTAKTLKRVSVQFNANDINSLNKQNKQMLEDVLVDLLNQSTLEFISINIDEDIEVVRNAIKQINMTERDRMRVKMSIMHEIDFALEYYSVFHKKLNENCKDFVFEFQCVLTDDMMGKITTFDFKPGDVFSLIVTNNGCKLNGFKERWIYPCACNTYCNID